jgi:hypothetical protein
MTKNQLSALALCLVMAISGMMLTFSGEAAKTDSESSSIPHISSSEPRIPIKSKFKNSISKECFPTKLSAGTKIHVLGAYEGGMETQLSIEGNSHEVGRIKMHAKSSGEPILLVVTAYDPVVWDFSDFPVNRLRAVLVSGYHDQAVAGLPKNVPLQINSHETPNAQCGEYGYAHEGGKNLDRLVKNLAMIFGREPDSFQGEYNPRSFTIDGQGIDGESQDDSIDPSAIRSTKTVTLDTIAPKETGLVQLINAGKIRPANANDISLLSKALTAASPTGMFASVKVDSSITHSLFVVLELTTLPKVMHGAHSANFIIPSGVPMPIDPGSHNTYYRLADGGYV